MVASSASLLLQRMPIAALADDEPSTGGRHLVGGRGGREGGGEGELGSCQPRGGEKRRWRRRRRCGLNSVVYSGRGGAGGSDRGFSEPCGCFLTRESGEESEHGVFGMSKIGAGPTRPRRSVEPFLSIIRRRSWTVCRMLRDEKRKKKVE